MTERPSCSSQYIEVPVSKRYTGPITISNVLLTGGLGYLLYKTILLEEKIQDLTSLMSRRVNQGNGGQFDREQFKHRNVRDYTYETTDHDAYREDEPENVKHNDHDDDDDDDDDDDGGSESGSDFNDRVKEMRIEEQPSDVPIRAPDPETKKASAFVTTRQRRTGSESRRVRSTTD